MNEPVPPGDKPDTEWLAGELEGKFYIQRIALDLAGRTRGEIARQWIAKLSSAIRAVDERHMITVGVVPWAQVFKGAKDEFYAPGVHGPLDFVSVHFYPKRGELAGSLEILKTYEIGKPLVIEEIFPLQASVEETAAFIDASRSHCDGCVGFYWGKPIEQNEKQGDMKGAMTAAWLRYFRSKAANAGWQTEK